MTLTRSAINRSGYVGVTWHVGHGKFMARIKIDGRSRFLGYFDSAEEAAIAYNAVASARPLSETRRRSTTRPPDADVLTPEEAAELFGEVA